VPLKRTEPFDTVRACARAIAERLVAQDPTICTTEIRLNKRRSRLFVDTGRNAFAQTAVAPYAVRAKPKAPVATPLLWKELNDPKLTTAQHYTITTIHQRLTKLGDPWKGINRSARSLARAKKLLKIG
jgi:bifunctional non-homologous end joining protein LigD